MFPFLFAYLTQKYIAIRLIVWVSHHAPARFQTGYQLTTKLKMGLIGLSPP